MNNYYLKPFIRLLTLGLLISLITSCKSSAPTIYVPLPIENEIHKRIVADDMNGLIQSYMNYPNYRHRLADYLFFSREYTNDSYPRLLEYCDLSVQDTTLHKGFTYILHQREALILTQLSECSLEEIVTYYQAHPIEHRFLDPVLRSTLLADLEKYDYQTLRKLNKVFQSTKFHAMIEKVYKPAKISIQKELNRDLKSYFNEEKKMLLQYRQSCESELLGYFQTSMQGLLEELLDKDLPDKKSSVDAYYQEIFDKHISLYQIDAIMRRYMDECQTNLNQGRTYYLSMLMEGETYQGYQVNIGSTSPNFAINHPMSYLYQLSEIQNETDWVGWGMTAASTVASLMSFGVAGFLIDAADVGRSVSKAKEDAEKMKGIIGQFSSSLFQEFQQNSHKHVRNTFRKLEVKVNQTQKSFKSIVNENY